MSRKLQHLYINTKVIFLRCINQAKADFTSDECTSFFQCGSSSVPELAGPYPSKGLLEASFKQDFAILCKTCSVSIIYTLQNMIWQWELYD